MKKYLDDARTLVSTLEETHPDHLFRCSKRRYSKGKEEFLAEASRTESLSDFSRSIKKFLHCIKDGHTSLRVVPDSSARRLPFDTVLVENRFFVEKVYASCGGVCDKAEIISVGGLPAFRYLTRTISLMSYEVRERALRNAAAYFPYAWAHSGGHLPSVMVVRSPGGKQSTLRLVWGKYDSLKPSWNESPCEFKYLADVRAGYLDWRQFIDSRTYAFCCKHGAIRDNKRGRPRLPEWEAFLRRTFGELNAKGARSLIIDLRRNTGGNSVLGENLIAHLTERPLKKFSGYIRLSPLLVKSYGEKYRKLLGKFPLGSKVSVEQEEAVLGVDPIAREFALKAPPEKLFKGQIVVLTSPSTYSAAETFAALIKDNSLGVLIGESTGNGSNGPIDSLSFTLPVSKLVVTVSFAFRLRPEVKARTTKLLKPDIHKKQTVSDFLSGRDTVLRYAMDFCNKSV